LIELIRVKLYIFGSLLAGIRVGAEANEPAPIAAKAKMCPRMPWQIGKIVCSRCSSLALGPNPMTQFLFDYGTVTISDGVIQAPSPTITALLDTLATALPGYGSIPCSTRTSTLHKVSSVW